MAPRWLTRSIRPPDPLEPNDNPAGVPPASVGPPDYNPGDPSGLVVEEGEAFVPPPPIMRPAPWDGWPGDWWTPAWNSQVMRLTDTAWTCVDLNASILATMPPYLVNAAPTVDSGWMTNPDPDIYSSWDEFAKSLFWDYQLGEVFVLATARYATGWPARFHVVPGWYVNVEMDAGRRRYSIGSVDVSADICHLRYQSAVDDAHGHGPLEAGSGKIIAAETLARYATGVVTQGGIPPSILTSPEQVTDAQADKIKARWITARQENLGAPAVLSGGLTWEATQFNPRDMALVELLTWTDSRIAVMLGVPPFLVGLPSGGDSMTYSNVTALFDYHWRAGLRPKAEAVMAGLSEWLLPRGTQVEVNKDAYVQPEPLQRAQTAQIYAGIVDPVTGQAALTVDEIREAERLSNATPTGGPIG